MSDAWALLRAAIARLNVQGILIEQLALRVAALEQQLRDLRGR